MRRPRQASCQIAGGMRREGEPQGSLCNERDGRGREEKWGRESPEIPLAPGVDDCRARPGLSKRTTWATSSCSPCLEGGAWTSGQPRCVGLAHGRERRSRERGPHAPAGRFRDPERQPSDSDRHAGPWGGVPM